MMERNVTRQHLLTYSGESSLSVDVFSGHRAYLVGVYVFPFVMGMELQPP